MATFSILGDLAQQVLGDGVSIRTLVGPNADAHVYEPTPADAAAVSTAALVVENGLGFEHWIGRLKAAADYRGPACIASHRVKALARAGAPDPHAWHDVSNARLYARAIADAWTALVPEDASSVQARLLELDGRLAALDDEVRERLSTTLPERRTVVTSHDAFAYFGAAYGIRFLAPLGFTTDSEPRPDRVAALIDQIRSEGVRALFLENMADPRLLELVATETGVRVGGRLFSDALSAPDGPATTYEAFMRFNVNAIATALG